MTLPVALFPRALYSATHIDSGITADPVCGALHFRFSVLPPKFALLTNPLVRLYGLSARTLTMFRTSNA